jgi:hypothetical protein
VQSTEVLSTRNDLGGGGTTGGMQLHEDPSKEETSLFDKQLMYDRSLLENPSQDMMNMQHYIS